MGTAELLYPSSQWLFLVSALLQETCSFPGGAEPAFGLLHAALLGCASIPDCSCPRACSAKLPLCRAGVGEVDATGAVALTWTGDLLQGPPQFLGPDTCLCRVCVWGALCHQLPKAMSGTNKWEHYRCPDHPGGDWLARISQPCRIMLSLCSAGL